MTVRSYPFKSGTAQVVVFNGYDQHGLTLSGRTLTRILAGKPVAIRGQGFPVEGVLEWDSWTFNHLVPGRIHIFTDTGREVFEGNLRDAEVAVVGPTRG